MISIYLFNQKCSLGSPIDFLAQALDAPKQQAISRALAILREVEAVDPNDLVLTPLGHHLAALPVNVRVGKMLVYAAIFNCLQPMVSNVYHQLNYTAAKLTIVM